MLQFLIIYYKYNFYFFLIYHKVIEVHLSISIYTLILGINTKQLLKVSLCIIVHL